MVNKRDFSLSHSYTVLFMSLHPALLFSSTPIQVMSILMNSVLSVSLGIFFNYVKIMSNYVKILT